MINDLTEGNEICGYNDFSDLVAFIREIKKHGNKVFEFDTPEELLVWLIEGLDKF